jgi:hypothetical protein
MSKYLELFANGFDATIAEKTEVKNWPYVGYSPSEGVVFTVIPKPVVYDPYVTFTAEEDNSSIGLAKLGKYQTLEYSMDTTTWNTFDTTTNITLAKAGDEVYVRGILRADNTGHKYTQFKMSGKIAASGNCNALWNYQDLNAPLKAYCGYCMFDSCISLTTSPELPATELADMCYELMFVNCTSLTTSPELPATTLAAQCYDGMFNGCTSLTVAPELSAATLAKSCYQGMFNGCTSLTVAPELPATTLASSCYSHMFNGCTSLTAAPKLPATTLANRCYIGMFNGCTSLTAAPELPATTLANNCYNSMFFNCTKLNYIKCLATNISATDCTYYWVVRVSSTGTFVKHPDMNDWTTGNSGIPSGWTVVDAEL